MQTVKLAGAALVVACGVWEGGRQSRLLTRRRVALQELLQLLRLLTVRVQYGGGLTEQEVISVCRTLPFTVLEPPDPAAEAQGGEAVAHWLEGLRRARYLPPETLLAVENALQSAVTRQQAEAKLAGCQELLAAGLAQATVQEQQNQRLYRQIGGLVGAMVAVIFW